MVAATDIGFVRMRVSKVVGLDDGDRVGKFVVLNELDGDRHLVIQIGSTEAFALAASLGDVAWGRPSAYAATVEAEGPHGVELVDARPSDALNLAVLVGAPIIVALEMVEDGDQRQEGDSAEAVLMRRALTAPPLTIRKAER
jgi:bifunctional DNase/RNase